MKTSAKLTVSAVLFVLMGVVVWFVLYYPADPLVYCQKIIDSALVQSGTANGTNAYPNVDGNSQRSFDLLAHYMHDDEEYVRAYGYVPGLTADDPPDLVLMYLKEKTRRTWHGDSSPTIWTEQKWMILGPAFLGNTVDGQTLPEGGALEDTANFKRRMQKTLEFLKKNDRPYWKNVVEEQSKFMDSIKD